ncbi:ABC transporter ATP-binding protein (plasmid) [Exiguobacterium acetylicum]
MITVSNLYKTINSRPILTDVNFSISQGECIGLLGPNGAGKTTLIKCMTGILNYDKGDIRFYSDPILSHKKHIGYLSQHTDFKPWMTCEESLMFFGKLSGLKKSELLHKIPLVLEEVGLQGKQKLKVEQLSGGMKQRLGIAQAILHEPQLLILDEPVSALDPIGRNEVKKLIGKLKKRTTIIISTHILDDASEFCDRYIVIKNGEIVGNIDEDYAELNRKQVLIRTNRAYTEEKIISFEKNDDTIEHIEYTSSRSFIFTGSHDLDLKTLLTKTQANDLDITSIEYYEKGIEDIFLEMVSET